MGLNESIRPKREQNEPGLDLKKITLDFLSSIDIERKVRFSKDFGSS